MGEKFVRECMCVRQGEYEYQVTVLTKRSTCGHTREKIYTYSWRKKENQFLVCCSLVFANWQHQWADFFLQSSWPGENFLKLIKSCLQEENKNKYKTQNEEKKCFDAIYSLHNSKNECSMRLFSLRLFNFFAEEATEKLK